ncbi:BTB/POZ and MATH domain-containing protein 2-like [Brachypodium distachyon]|uniref:BTB/POZ and MATH domain-containing protein 2-like n=1 Tax=Brachypodium distachyon TaxID=15368 RepID=UPI000D0E0EEB|nr:BTB/POZ and MATH domain-containing protein 2-like [Brachypodium distachyon]|eukprot:XP_024317146.1 BTB/POZ and MATH domain-containing protein 2-like [Brachypodium distachyon]
MESACKKTASVCTSETARGTHVFAIEGYSLKNGMGVGKFLQSTTFTVGGYDWAIRVYPDGTVQHSEDSVVIYIMLSIALRVCWPARPTDEPPLFKASSCRHGIRVHKSKLQNSTCIQDDRLLVTCDLLVIKESKVYETRESSEIEVPPSNITEHLGKLLEAKEEADVTFRVGEETFQAHKILLAVRSPVFRAELCGPMRETSTRCVTIQDMQPAVFRALLHFIYTDSLPDDMDALEEGDKREMVCHLLVAADRYDVDRLKLICQNILGKNLDVETVATTLALADQHHCDRLKDACIGFIASSEKMDDVVATEGLANIKRSCPSVVIDALEKRRKYAEA